MLPSVNVNPSSSTEATSGASSGGGGITFAFGGNPNLALLNGGAGGINWLLVGGVAAAVVLGLLLWKR